MKKVIGAVGVAAFLAACGGAAPPERPAAETEAKVETAVDALVPGDTYACPMHPEVTAGAPGRCAKCGMNLEPVGETAAETEAVAETAAAETGGAAHAGH